MRIAITTFFQSQTNYGQLLQAFALQQVLMRMGHFPYIIRYGFHESLPLTLGMEPIEPNFDKLLDKAKWEVAKSGCSANRYFDDFRQNHLNLSKNAYNHLEEIQLFPPIADCYLTGSDQVWAQLLSYIDNQIYFLNFGPENILRISYAPSFSLKSYPPELNGQLKECLNRFDAISVREKTGIDICKNVGSNAKWVADPTMLLDGDYYRRLAKESQMELPVNYMFVYHVNVKREDFPFWSDFNRYNFNQGIRAIAVHANGEGQSDIEFIENAEYFYPSIQDWIRIIDGSEYVLTTSFHGMIFSILLHKPFFVGLRPESMFAGNDRIISVLADLGLQERIITDDMNLQKIMQEPINWNEVDEKLEAIRSVSLAFLKEHLGCKKGAWEIQQWKQYCLEEVNKFIFSKRKEKEIYEQRFLQIQQQNVALQQQTSELQREIESLNAERNRLIQKKKKYLNIGRWLIGLLIVSFVLVIFSYAS